MVADTNWHFYFPREHAGSKKQRVNPAVSAGRDDVRPARSAISVNFVRFHQILQLWRSPPFDRRNRTEGGRSQG
jgi:hypothetical protein